MRSTRLSSIVLAALAVSLLVAPASAKTAEEILNTALERYQESTEDIDNFTLVQEVMGHQMVLKFEKQMVDGQPVFVPEGGSAGSSWGNFYGVYKPLAKKARLEGDEVVEGVSTHVVRIDDFSDVDFGELGMGDDGSFVPKEATLFIGKDDSLLRKVVMDGEMSGTERSGALSVEVEMHDYQQVEGMWHPFRVLGAAEGLQSGMSAEDLEQAKRRMAQLQEQMDNMSDQQRSMMEGMLKPQLEQLQKMLESGKFEFTVLTKELRVNE